MISDPNIPTAFFDLLVTMAPFAAALFCAPRGSDQGASRIPVKPAINFKAEAFDLSQVRLLDSSFRDAMLRDYKYVMSLDPDRLLHTFRLTAGLSTSAFATLAQQHRIELQVGMMARGRVPTGRRGPRWGLCCTRLSVHDC